MKTWYIVLAITAVVGIASAFISILELVPLGSGAFLFSLREIVSLLGALAALVLLVVGFHVASQVVNDPKVGARIEAEKEAAEAEE